MAWDNSLIVFYSEILAIAVCLGFLVFLSLVEAAITQSSPLTLRMMTEGEQRETIPPLMNVVLEDELQLIVPLHLGTQVSLITIAILTTHLSIGEWHAWGVGCSFGIMFLLSLIFRQMVPRLVAQHEPEKKLVFLLRAFAPLYGLLRSLAWPLSSLLTHFRRLQEKRNSEPASRNADASEKEIQAYLEIGEDEGIIEKEDSKLIQSVVEFGDTLVREVMTPRTKIVACDESAPMSELREIMVRNAHSRIPVYRQNPDHVVGIAYIRHLLAHYSHGRESDPVRTIVHPALFVPETKKVSALMKELQERGDHAALVIDEFGGVSGLVTMEDLLEEIVGEIRDEDQTKTSEIVDEGGKRYTLRGGTEVHLLEELAGKKLEGADSATVAGLIVTYLGRVPAPGEEFEMAGLRIRILDADRKKVHRVRIQM